jgi:germination protein, Ger(x)C family
MKKHVGILFMTAICLLLIMSLSGCWNSRELDTLGIVMGIGIDKPKESNKVQVTAQIVKPGEMKSSKKEGGDGSGGKAFWNVEGTGETVFSTLRDLTSKSSRKLFFPHNQVLIFGRSLAEEGVQKYVDFFVRDPETRMNVWVLVSQGTAGEVLDVKSELEKVPSNNIAKLIKGYAGATSQTSAVRLRDFESRLMSKTTAPIAPFIEISGYGEEKVAMISGTAVFKRDKLVGEMDKIEGRGLSWVLGEVKSGIIEVEGSDKNIVGLEIIRASGKIVPEIEGDRIKIEVNITEEGNIAEQTGSENLAKLPEIAKLEEKESEVIQNEVMAAVKKAQELDADVFGFGDAVHQNYPEQWKDMESNWDDIFPDIEVEVNVEAKLRLMGRTTKPAASE